jgi:UDP-3-O-[3-hydroxymyristoyl] glucosamine N-acyltransferase
MVAPIDGADASSITFLSNNKYAKLLAETKAAACILKEDQVVSVPDGTVPVIAQDPYVAYAKIAAYLHPDSSQEKTIAASAVIASSAQLGEGVSVAANAVIEDGAKIGDHVVIGAGCYIGANVEIAEHSCIHANASITHALIGRSVIIHSGVCIGQDGFGYATEHGRHIKVPQLGRVVIEDEVEIGANCCIDRGAGPDTIIGQGSKIDNLVQIGHNVQIGKVCILVSQSGISGSTKLGDYVVLGGQAGIAGHLSIGSLVQVAAKSGVINDLKPQTTVGGYPAVPVKQWHRQTVAVKKLVQKKGV